MNTQIEMTQTFDTPFSTQHVRDFMEEMNQ